MDDDVLTAFDALLGAMSSEKAQLADAVKEATLSAQFAEAQRLLAKTERVERLMEQARRLREAWERLDETEDSFVAGEKPDTAIIGAERVDDEDAPELAVVEQLFGERRRRKRKLRPPVNKTPKQAYRVPILQALEQLGGRGRIDEVLNIVYEIMKTHLTEDDLKPLPEEGNVRWRNTAAWERYRMVNDGLLRDDSPRGIWEMTEKGRAYLERARQQGTGGNEP